MELARGFRVKNQSRIQNLQGGGPDCKFVIKIPHSRVFRVLSRSLFLALAIVTFPCLGSIISNSSKNAYKIDSDPINGESLPLIFKDLMNEGILKLGDKGILFGTGDSDETSMIKFHNGMDLISESDIERQNSIPDDTLDFVLVSGFCAVTFIDRTLKTGGVAIIQLSDNPSNTFRIPLNYKIKYFRRFERTILALRKTGPGDSTENSPTKRRLLGFDFKAKEAALKGLEDVLLEPPRDASMNFNKYLKRTKFLPDLMGDSLDGYPRLVFIDVVMKAEVEVVEEILKNRTIFLVDELFLQCNNQWQIGMKKNKNKSRRAYWECLALYGRLRDEGIAVHQWWS